MRISKILLCIIVAIAITSCGTRRTVKISSVLDNAIVVGANDTIVTFKRLLPIMQIDSEYIILMRKGRCVDIMSKIKSKH
ncbi:MAG: hypothetical protein WA775_02870 [Psychroserpens sp.]|uniref:hypothetical protein n=1 Tax=Psychroserpens sp. TaxID=2020870 RepID=UPI003C9BAB48